MLAACSLAKLIEVTNLVAGEGSHTYWLIYSLLALNRYVHTLLLIYALIFPTFTRADSTVAQLVALVDWMETFQLQKWLRITCQSRLDKISLNTPARLAPLAETLLPARSLRRSMRRSMRRMTRRMRKVRTG